MMNTAFQLGGGALTSNRATFSLFIKKVFHQVKSFFKRENKNFAFTLAETLIVMGIIGVVAALTIPNLNASTSEAEKVAKVKKIYAQLNEALGRAVAKYGPYGTWFVNDNGKAAYIKRAAERMTEFLKVSKVCGTTGTGCFSNKPYFSINSYKFSTFDIKEYVSSFEDMLIDSGVYCVVLADGTSVGFYYYNDDIIEISVDIDGPNKGKNTEGIDIFRFGIEEVNKDVKINDREEAKFMTRDGESYIDLYNGTYISPVLWVLQNGNLDYLKCPEKLNWTTKTSCK